MHLSCDVCLEVRGENCSVLYCVLKLCTVINTLRWAVLTVLWIGFCHTGPISLYIDLFVFICVYFVFLFHTAYTLYYCEHSGVDLMVLKRNPYDLFSFSAFTPKTHVPDMTYNVFGGTLNLVQFQLLLSGSRWFTLVSLFTKEYKLVLVSMVMLWSWKGNCGPDRIMQQAYCGLCN